MPEIIQNQHSIDHFFSAMGAAVETEEVDAQFQRELALAYTETEIKTVIADYLRDHKTMNLWSPNLDWHQEDRKHSEYILALYERLKQLVLVDKSPMTDKKRVLITRIVNKVSEEIDEAYVFLTGVKSMPKHLLIPASQATIEKAQLLGLSEQDYKWVLFLTAEAEYFDRYNQNDLENFNFALGMRFKHSWNLGECPWTEEEQAAFQIMVGRGQGMMDLEEAAVADEIMADLIEDNLEIAQSIGDAALTEAGFDVTFDELVAIDRADEDREYALENRMYLSDELEFHSGADDRFPQVMYFIRRVRFLFLLFEVLYNLDE